MLPPTVDTFEKLLVFAALALESVAINKEVVLRLQDGSTETRKLIDLGDFVDNSNSRRFAVSAYIPVPLDAHVSPNKLFSIALPVADANVGADYITA